MDFAQVMKDWRRMCKAQDELRGDRACYGCPLESYGCPSIYDDVDNADYADVENKVNAWAAEHPEPVYPTWWKYMCMIGVIPNSLGDKTLGEVTVERLMHISIPADIAEKLGLQPKEGT